MRSNLLGTDQTSSPRSANGHCYIYGFRACVSHIGDDVFSGHTAVFAPTRWRVMDGYRGTGLQSHVSRSRWNQVEYGNGNRTVISQFNFPFVLSPHQFHG